MLGILLTYDDQLGLAELVHKSYAALWPDMPVHFRLPYNGSAKGPAFEYLQAQERCEFVSCGKGIIETMHALLADVEDSDWVYWCIDDRYPTWVDTGRCAAALDALSQLPSDADELKLLHWKERLAGHAIDIGGERFLHQTPAERYWGFWHHHPVRARVLRSVFFRDEIMDPCTIAEINKAFKLSASQLFLGKALVPATPMLALAEPLRYGRLTLNGLADLERLDCEIPPYELLEQDIRFERSPVTPD